MSLRTSFFVPAVFFGQLLLGQTPNSLFVNEVLASNSTGLADATGNRGDWIELYNPGTAAIPLHDWYISDDVTRPLKHRIADPDGLLHVPAGGFLVLWADDRTDRGPAHLNFNLSAAGELVLLVAPDGRTIVNEFAFPEQYTDISYGRRTDGAVAVGYFQQPTPNASNAGSTAYQGMLAAPVFSVASGFHAAGFNTRISVADPAARILYTSDGSLPREELLTGSEYSYKNQYQENPSNPAYPFLRDTLWAMEYTGPIAVPDVPVGGNDLVRRTSSITNWAVAEYVPTAPMRKATVLRARAFRSGWLPSPVTTVTYFVTPEGANSFDLPVVSIATDKTALFGYEDGVYTPGVDFDNWRAANPEATADYRSPGNWDRSTESLLSLDLFDKGASRAAVSANASFRLHGGASRMSPRKSMRLYFRSENGRSNLGFRIFPDRPHEAYKRLILHNSGNDERWTNMRDMTLQAMVRHMRFFTQDARPAILLINGEYWGVNPLRERYDRHFFERELGIVEAELDLLENNAEVSEGDAAHYTALFDLVGENGTPDDAKMADVATRMDLDNMIDYYSANIFMVNADWPHNNVRFFRKRTASYEPDALPGHDGRWRFVMYDTDFGLGGPPTYPPTHNMMHWATTANGNGNGEWATRLFRNFVRNEGFRNAFVNRHADMLNTAYLPARTEEVIEEHRAMMQPAMQEHLLRWRGRPGGIDTWNSLVDDMVEFARQRPQHARTEVANFFRLEGQHAVTLDVSDPAHGYVHINTIDILPSTVGVGADPYPWSGIYFGGVPVVLTAKAHPGYVFDHWEGDASGSSASITLDPLQALSVRAVFVEGVRCDARTLHYWHFNAVGGSRFEEVAADAGEIGSGSISYPGSGSAYMDGTNMVEGTVMNALPDVPADRALRARNPSDTRWLLIEASGQGHRDIELSFATTRTNNGAEEQRVQWTTDPERAAWNDLGAAYTVHTDWQLKRFALPQEIAAYDQEHLAFRVLFQGSGASGTSGNDRFDNIQVTGHPLAFAEATICSGEPYLRDGVSYTAAGRYLHRDPSVLDCSHYVLLDVSAADPDTAVLISGSVLSAVPDQDGYRWLDCDNGFAELPNGTGSRYEPVVNGDYAVEVTQGGCRLRSACHRIISLGVADPSLATLQLRPNPASDVVYLHRQGVAGSIQVQLVDLHGRVAADFGAVAGEVVALPVGGLAPGLYVLRTSDGHNMRLVKE